MAQLNRPLSNTISIYLDALRFGAAVIVLLAHVAHERFGNQALGFHAPGGDAVIVFFVLSGFVIAYVAETKENNLADFLSARFARLWSVLLPALVLTAAVELLCWRVDSSQREVFKFLATATFAGELWFSDQTPLLNAPAWTLSFELWYYLLFAAYIFVGRWRWLWVSLAVLVCGPKILLLLPVWVLGVVTYRHLGIAQRAIPEWMGWLLFLAPVAIYAFFKVVGFDDILEARTGALIGPTAFEDLGAAQNFVWPYVVGLLAAANFIGLAVVEQRFARLAIITGGAIKGAASCTLSIYLFHFPLMALALVLSAPYLDQPARAIFMVAFALTGSIFFGMIFEHRRHAMKNMLLGAFRLIESIGGVDRLSATAPANR